MLNYNTLTNEKYTENLVNLIIQTEKLHENAIKIGDGKILLNVKEIRGLVFIIGIFFLMINITHASSDINMPICKKIRKSLVKRQKLFFSGKGIQNFGLEYDFIGGHDISYKNLDIDNDKIDDDVLTSCGASLISGCSIFIDTSSGLYLRLDEARFYLIAIKSTLYIIVGDSITEPEKKKRGTRRVYKITKESINMICSNI